MRTNVPKAVRALRASVGSRQADIGRGAGLSRSYVSRVERGELRGLTVDSLDRLAEALGAVLVVELRWHGADLDRLIDSAHAALQERVAERLRAAGWTTYVEVSFNHYGDRGRCDLLGWHAASRTLLVVEAKTRLGNLQETLGSLDVKRRLGRVLAEQVGCGVPNAVVAALVVAEQRTARRIVRRYPSMFSSFVLRGRAATAWIAAPVGRPAGVLWFELLPNSHSSRTIGVERVRVRLSDTPDAQTPKTDGHLGA